MVFASGKGGVGTSTMAALMAVGLARRGEQVLLIDGSQGWLHMLFGITETRGLSAVRAGRATPQRAADSRFATGWICCRPRSATRRSCST